MSKTSYIYFFFGQLSLMAISYSPTSPYPKIKNVMCKIMTISNSTLTIVKILFLFFTDRIGWSVTYFKNLVIWFYIDNEWS